LSAVEVEGVQEAMGDRQDDNARDTDEDKAGKQGVYPRKELGGRRMKFSHRPHAAEDHRGIKK